MANKSVWSDRLIGRVRYLGHPLCAGLDPHLARIPPLFHRGTMKVDDPATATAVEDFLGAFVERLAGRVAVVKPQSAFFERLGWRGLRALERVAAKARDNELLVLLDAKRGDIGSTAAAYAAAYLGNDASSDSGHGYDALTINPYLGLDTLEPFLETAADNGNGVFVLVKTSNAGAGDLQDQRLEGGALLHEHLAQALAERAKAMVGPESGFSSLGVVVGATWPGEAEKLREMMPRCLFLVPGYGAQGGSAGDAVRGFVRGADGRLEGGIVNSSRGLLFPAGSVTEDARRWERAIDDGISRAIDELTAAVSS